MSWIGVLEFARYACAICGEKAEVPLKTLPNEARVHIPPEGWSLLKVTLFESGRGEPKIETHEHCCSLACSERAMARILASIKEPRPTAKT